MHIDVDADVDRDGRTMPRRFYLHGRYVSVVEALDQWHGTDHRYVKVKSDDGGRYILRFDEPYGPWTLTMFESEKVQALSASSGRSQR